MRCDSLRNFNLDTVLVFCLLRFFDIRRPFPTPLPAFVTMINSGRHIYLGLATHSPSES
jgi:hypothetical protein